ncbi:MAG TPA: ABC-F family ATP-binding cassette domain-containing protein [Caldisericia bacterium]|nr:ABC-F family ATP-binding cassette domain-containing protein [Caldisericia bacterium]
MGQIQVQNITKYFGVKAVLDGISFTLGGNDRLALVGANGTGKSTLIKIIMDQMEPDDGKVFKEPDKVIGYFAQDRSLDVSDVILFDQVRSAFKNIYETGRQLEEISLKVEKDPHNPQLLAKFEKLQHQYEALGGYDIDHRIERILSGLGFSKEDWKRPVVSLSGGERSRLQLATILATEPDTLVLDEPTNHLDLEATIWLEGFLQEFKGSVLIVSHDRYLLDKVCNHTVILIDGKAFDFTGNFTQARAQYDLEREHSLEKLQEQQEFIERANRFIKRFKGYGTEVAAKRARSMERRLERVVQVEALPQEKKVQLNLESSGRTGEIVFRTKSLSKSFGDRELFGGLNLEMKRGQKIALMGPNGCGKTTFLKTVIGEEEPSSGEVWLGYNVSMAYLEQELGSFNPEATVIEEIMNNSDLKPQEARDHLATFLFVGDDVSKLCKALSGGEISRLILAKLALIDANFIIFDEPTNHLDINARASLEDTIKNYSGSVLLVSHDRYFINNIGATIWAFDGNNIVDTRGSLEEYLQRKPEKQTDKGDQKTQQKQKKKDQGPSKNQIKSMQDRLKNFEDEISMLESRKSDIEQSMSNPDFYSRGEQTKLDLDEYDKIKIQLAETENAWAELSEELSAISPQ